MFILKKVFNFQFGSHQSSNHNNCFLVILANGSLGHKLTQDQSKGNVALF